MIGSERALLGNGVAAMNLGMCSSVTSDSPEPFEDRSNLGRLLRDRIRPSPISSIRVDCRHPSLGCGPFDFFEGVKAFGLEDQVDGRGGLEADDEVGDVVVGLAVVEVGDREAEALVLYEGFDLVVGVEVIGGLL